HGGKLRINFESFFHGIRPFLTGSMAETGTPNQVFFSVLPKVAVKDYMAIPLLLSFPLTPCRISGVAFFSYLAGTGL
ncbi:MAG: indoleamine 2,3-dioxygenase, partial [Sulfuricella sp.]|nr:indoleamine 2,3-dioxygenase [Sulfuricella sp.]